MLGRIPRFADRPVAGVARRLSLRLPCLGFFAQYATQFVFVLRRKRGAKLQQFTLAADLGLGGSDVAQLAVVLGRECG